MPCSIFAGGCSEAHGTTMPSKLCGVASLGQEDCGAAEKKRRRRRAQIAVNFPRENDVAYYRARPPDPTRPDPGQELWPSNHLRYLAVAMSHDRAFHISITGHLCSCNDVTATAKEIRFSRLLIDPPSFSHVETLESRQKEEGRCGKK